MTPNGQPRTFREVMEEALETIESDTHVVPNLIQNILRARDVPAKAKPFVAQLSEFQKTLTICELMNDELETSQAKIEFTAKSATIIKDVESSCAKLLEVSEVNPSIQKFSKKVCDEVTFFLTLLKEMLGQPEDTESLIAGLNDLFDDN